MATTTKEKVIFSNGKEFETIDDSVIVEIDEGRPCLVCNDKCPGFALHPWRNTCKQCKCSREAHDILVKPDVCLYDRLGLVCSNQTKQDIQADRERAFRMGFSWIPDGMEKMKLDDYLHQLDNNKIPRLESEGERLRLGQLISQLPKQDFSKIYSRQLKSEEQRQVFEGFVKSRLDCLDVASIQNVTGESKQCHQCKGELQPHDLAVVAAKVNATAVWHAACFVCSTCEELLVDLCYCAKDGAIHCERHFAELFRPRCAACDELIFSGEYTKAMDQDWHNGHFACFHCDMNLTGHRYVLRDNHPYCIECYEELFAHACHDCKQVISTDSKDLSYKDMHWHEKCFKCFDCHLSLVDKPFATTNNQLYCADCHDNNFAPKCDKCRKVFKSGMKKYEYNDKQFHLECFSCHECKQPIEDQSFVPRNQVVVCVPCYEKHHAQRCYQCKGVISKGGVSYKDESFHRECFVCKMCSKQLSGEKFINKEEHAYCVECFNERFAKKCHQCHKPISGASGSTKYVTFEERQWHSNCFKCTGCEASLVGQGFVMDGEAIMCSQCVQ